MTPRRGRFVRRVREVLIEGDDDAAGGASDLDDLVVGQCSKLVRFGRNDRESKANLKKPPEFWGKIGVE